MPDKKLQTELSALFNLPSEKAIAYFEKKVALGPKKHWDWTDTMRHAHDRVFVVSKATSIDIVKDIHTSLLKAIKEGKTYQEFANDIIPTLKEKGWWGDIDAVNKDQKIVKPIKVDHRRLRSIFNTNVKTAYAAGRYERMMEDADIAPYWRYVAVPKGAGNINPRIEHAALHNLVFRYDDPFWQTHYAPNGWGCHCTVVRMTKRMVEKKFGKPVDDVVRESKPEDFVTKTEEIEREHINLDGTATTQKVQITTTGYKIGNTVVYPSQGWDYAPGAYNSIYSAQKSLYKKIIANPSDARKIMEDQFKGNLKETLAQIIDVESTLPLNQKDKMAIALMPNKVADSLFGYQLENGKKVSFETPILTATQDAIFHGQRPRKKSDWGKSIPLDLFKDIQKLVDTYEPRIEPDGTLLFYSDVFTENGHPYRYKIVFVQDAKFKEYSLKTCGRVASNNIDENSHPL